MSEIPLIPRPFRKLSQSDLKVYAITKKDQEERALANNPTQTSMLASAYERHIEEERKRLGL
jgi:hypothetical protein